MATKEFTVETAKRLMAEYDLTEERGWRFVLGRSWKGYGHCQVIYLRGGGVLGGKITVNAPALPYQPESEVEDTIRHEIAHALTDPRLPDHGAAWKAKAVEVGARPVACGGDLPVEFHQALKAKQVRAHCLDCSKVVGTPRMRMPSEGAVFRHSNCASAKTAKGGLVEWRRP